MSDHPLRKSLPPATDYLTYLTILEYNLKPEQLPSLHEVLQDQELTSNIGWDLVHLLLPLLPAAEQCLQDVARLGNPREVVLKVTESLRAIYTELDSGASDNDDQQAENVAEDEKVKARRTDGQDSAEGAQKGGQEELTKVDADATSIPLSIRQFNALLSMLSVLHPRIKTKYPSRFFSTSLRAVLTAYTRLAWSPEATAAVIQFVKALSGQKRPNLPPRMSSRGIRTIPSQPSAPDPEAQLEPPTSEETALQQRLLQSFITHVLEDYILCMPLADGVMRMAWTSRLQEKAHPEKTIPGRTTSVQKFAQSEKLHARDAMALARDLDVSSQELLSIITQPEADPEPLDDEDAFPSSASAIPLSRVGALYLFAAKKASCKLFGSPAFDPEISIYPDHAHIVENFLGSDNMTSIGTEAESLIDAVLCLGVFAFEDGLLGDPRDDEHFNKYLQRLSLLSANTPSPTLRYHAHILTSSILHSHPSDLVRLTFIRDTLQHCPYENLKASAIGWLKDEVITADKTAHLDRAHQLSVFATPVAIDTAAPYILLDLAEALQQPSTSDSWTAFKVNFSFYLASLNFYYLLLSSQHIRQSLGIVDLHTRQQISKQFLDPLREASKQYQAAFENGPLAEEEGQAGVIGGLSDLLILDDALGRVSDAMAAVGLQ
ncbi:MAG: hypothetical protein M1830_003551 [Pleopsidium flavum]|nr:MAG: hypothetical protein M1830_003551 [Pleopsidium flavum]